MAFKALLAAVALAALLGMAAADCPNACSGHGVCQSHRDFCECYKGFQGNDCSQRTCAFGLSWVDTPQGDLNHDNDLNDGFGDREAYSPWWRPTGTPNSTALNPMWRPDGWWENHPSQLYGVHSQSANLPRRQQVDEGHFYAECSNRGICDRETGLCACFTGYEGAACNRTACANDCSGHGTCESIRELGKSTTVDPTEKDYMLWDADKSMGCLCDPEYFGVDCSKRRCYRNDDPLTDSTSTRGMSEKLSEQGETQIIKVQCDNSGQVQASSTITITYTDVQFGEAYTTSSFAPTTATAADVQALLRALPNQVLASTQTGASTWDHKVTVRKDSYDASFVPESDVYRFYIDFDESLGNVPLISVDFSGVTCSAGWGLPASYKSDAAWQEQVEVQLIGTGPTVDTAVRVKVETEDSGGTGDDYKYCIATGTTTPCTDYSAGTVPFPVATGFEYLEGTASTASRASALNDLLAAKFKWPLGKDESTSLRVDEATYDIQFYAPAKTSCTVYTQMHNISSTLPITYQVASRGNGDTLFVDYQTPFETAWRSTNYTITMDATSSPDSYTWAANGGAASSAIDVPDADTWFQLDGCTSWDCYVTFAFDLADGAHTDGDIWTVAANAGEVSSSGGANDEILWLSWANGITSYPIERANIVISAVRLGAAHDTDPDRYQWTLNGVEQGEYDFAAGVNRLGGTSTSELSDLYFEFGGGAQHPDRDPSHANGARTWRFALINTPIQSAWAYQETLRVHWFSSDPSVGSRAVPTANLAIVINIQTTDAAVDTYRWKLTTDEVWYSGNSFTAEPANLGQSSSHPTQSANLQKLYFDFSGGAGSNLRSCDSDSTNAWYYVQFGQEGINDFGTCSDRGICDEETGLCKCFKGYAGQDCREQHALAL